MYVTACAQYVPYKLNVLSKHATQDTLKRGGIGQIRTYVGELITSTSTKHLLLYSAPTLYFILVPNYLRVRST